MNHADPRGLLMKGDYKWNILPLNGKTLAGFYVKPELVWANFDYTDSDVLASAPRRHVSRWALLAEAGYQLVVRWFVFDVYAGVGPSFGDVATNNYYHSFMLFPAESHLAFTAGFRIGVAF